MNLFEFEDHLDRHGGDLAAWPTEIRGLAAGFLAISSDARSAWQAMSEVERFIAGSRVEANGIDRFAEVASRQRQVRHVAPSVRRAAWAAAAMIVLVMGLAIGDIRPIHDDGTDLLMATSLEPLGVNDVD